MAGKLKSPVRTTKDGLEVSLILCGIIYQCHHPGWAGDSTLHNNIFSICFPPCSCPFLCPWQLKMPHNPHPPLCREPPYLSCPIDLSQRVCKCSSWHTSHGTPHTKFCSCQCYCDSGTVSTHGGKGGRFQQIC